VGEVDALEEEAEQVVLAGGRLARPAGVQVVQELPDGLDVVRVEVPRDGAGFSAAEATCSARLSAIRPSIRAYRSGVRTVDARILSRFASSAAISRVRPSACSRSSSATTSAARLLLP
jgi:hypothetical protein